MWGFYFTQCRSSNIHKILNNLYVVNPSGIDHIFAKFLKDGDPVIAIQLANIINMLIKFDTFPLKCNIAEIKHFLRRN